MAIIGTIDARAWRELRGEDVERNDSFAPALFPRSPSFLFIPPPFVPRYEITPDLERRALSLVLLAARALSRKLLAADDRGAKIRESKRCSVMYSSLRCVSRTCFARVREMRSRWMYINIHVLSVKMGEAAESRGDESSPFALIHDFFFPSVFEDR